MKSQIAQALHDCKRAVEYLGSAEAVAFIESAAALIADCYRNGGRLIVAGNGGSLCDAAHFAEELTGQFRKRRQALPAIALNDAAHITCVANDFGFDEIFSRGVEAHGQPGDIFIGLTTSGNSPNILRAFDKAKERGLSTIAFLGKSGGKARGVANLELTIAGFDHSDRIQEAHMAAIHIIIELVEQKLFYDVAACSENVNSTP